MLPEVLDNDLDLLRDVVRVQPNPAHDLLHGGAAFDFLIVPLLAVVGQPEGQLVGRVVPQHVEDEPLLDGLPHGIDVEGGGNVVFPGWYKLGAGQLTAGHKGYIVSSARRGYGTSAGTVLVMPESTRSEFNEFFRFMKFLILAIFFVVGLMFLAESMQGIRNWIRDFLTPSQTFVSKVKAVGLSEAGDLVALVASNSAVEFWEQSTSWTYEGKEIIACCDYDLEYRFDLRKAKVDVANDLQTAREQFASIAEKVKG